MNVEFWFYICTSICCSFIVIVALGILINQTGVLQVGHAAFVGVGAYAGGLVMNAADRMPAGLALLLCVMSAVAVGGVLAALTGLAILRLRGDGFIMGSIGALVAFDAIANNWSHVTGGALGLGVGQRFSSGFLFVCIASSALATGAVVYRLLKRKGPNMRSLVRGDAFAQSVGIAPDSLRLMAFVYAGSLAALAGAFQGLHFGSVFPSSFGLTESIALVATVLFGAAFAPRMYQAFVGLVGVARGVQPKRKRSIPAEHVIGALFSAAFFTSLPEVFRVLESGQWRQVLFGALLVGLLLMRNRVEGDSLGGFSESAK